MYSLNPYIFIHTGLCIRCLMHSSGWNIKNILDEADKLTANLKNAGFVVSLAALFHLNQLLDKLKQNGNLDRIITGEEQSELNGIMFSIEKTTYSEAQTKKIYIVSEGRFSLDKLLDHPDQLLAKEAYTKLPDIAKFDLAESFKCIVFSRSTAAAFHILRATESLLKSYYLLKIKRGREQNPMWGNMLRALQQKRDKNESLLQQLDYIKANYRNPTAHPDAKYDLETAEDLISLCINVINKMALEIPTTATPLAAI